MTAAERGDISLFEAWKQGFQTGYDLSVFDSKPQNPYAERIICPVCGRSTRVVRVRGGGNLVECLNPLCESHEAKTAEQ